MERRRSDEGEAPVRKRTCGIGFLVMLAVPAVAAPIALTNGPGNDTEAAWSPDGQRIVFQSDRSGDLDLYVLELATRRTRPLVAGPGNACYPAWSPDGKWIAYSYADITKTAVQGIENGYNLFMIPSSGGEPRRLTSGVVRDYLPSFAPDGKHIYFSSTRGLKRNSVCLQRVPVAGGEPETVIAQDHTDVAMVQPDISPDGRHIAYGMIRGFRSNWVIRLAKTSAPEKFFPLTDPEMVMYGPRWSPDGSLLACTGFRAGDPGWGIYVIDLSTRGLARLDTGPGNSRSAAWSPDMQDLVFENNRSGSYKLYRISLPGLTFQPLREHVEEELKEVLHFAFGEHPDGVVKDLSGNGNDGKIVGDVPWTEGALTFGSGGYITIPKPTGFDFGPGSFSVSATVLIEKHTDDLRLLVVGDYPENRLGWQIIISTDNYIWFNSRSLGGEWVAARSDELPPLGRKIDLLGIRYRDGHVELYVDGVCQTTIGSRAKFHYGVPNQLRIGTQFNGSAPFVGKLYELQVYSGVVDVGEGRARTLREFLGQ